MHARRWCTVLVLVSLLAAPCAAVDDTPPGGDGFNAPARSHVTPVRLDDAFEAESKPNPLVRLKDEAADASEAGSSMCTIMDASAPVVPGELAFFLGYVDTWVSDLHLLYNRAEGPHLGNLYTCTLKEFSMLFAQKMFCCVRYIYGLPARDYYWNVDVFRAVLQVIFGHKPYQVILVCHDATQQIGLMSSIDVVAAEIDSSVVKLLALFTPHPVFDQHASNLAHLHINAAVQQASLPLYHIIQAQEDEINGLHHVIDMLQNVPDSPPMHDDGIVVPGTPPQSTPEPMLPFVADDVAQLPMQIAPAYHNFVEDNIQLNDLLNGFTPTGVADHFIDFSDEEDVMQPVAACG